MQVSRFQCKSHDFSASLTISVQVSRFQCKSHGLTAKQANLTGSPLRRVNIYKCYSNGADFLPEKCGLVLETVTEFLLIFTAEEGCVFMTLNTATQASIDAVSDSESSIFLQWVWLARNSIGATPTRQPS